MSAAHTPGPWRVARQGRAVTVRAGDGSPVAEIWRRGDDHAAEDAALIAKAPIAPKLAEALRALCDAVAPLRGTSESMAAYVAARDALSEWDAQ